MTQTLFDDQAQRRPDAKQGQKVVYEDEPSDKRTRSEDVRDRSYADVDTSAKQDEYLRTCFGLDAGTFSMRLWEQRKEVEQVLFDSHQPELTDMEAARILGWPRSSVNGRRNELVEKGVVRDAGERECRVTGSTATIWKPVRTLFE